MPAATVGAAYSEKRHIESAKGVYGTETEQGYRETVRVLEDLTGLDLSGREEPSSLEKKAD